MKTLFVTNALPWPAVTGAQKRVYHAIAALSRSSAVTIFAGRRQDAPLEHVVSPCPGVTEAYFFSLDSLAWYRQQRYGSVGSVLMTVVRHLHPVLPVDVQFYASRVVRRLARELALRDFDLIWANGVACCSWLPSGSSRQLVVDCSDVEYRKLSLKLSNVPWYPMRVLDGLECRKWRRLEHRVLRRPYRVVVCSEADRAALGGPPNVVVVPNGVDIPEACSAPVREPKTLVFPGSMFYHPNVDGATHFVDKILPLILAVEPAVKLEIVGRAPVRKVLKLADHPNVEVLADVPEMSAFLQRATAVIVPLRYGGGTRIKILEALAHSSAVVSTRIGADGLDLEDGQHILIADNDRDFANACITLLQHETLRQSLGRNGCALVRQRYDWQQIESDFGAVVTGLIGTGHPVSQDTPGSL